MDGDNGNQTKTASRPNGFTILCALLASGTSVLLGYDIGAMSGASVLIKKDMGISSLRQEILNTRGDQA